MEKVKILIIDDEVEILETIGDVLIDEGFSVFKASNAKQAKQICLSSTLDLILLDIWMPDIDGISLLKELVEDGLKTPIVIMSGHGNVETAVQSIKYGAYDFLEKPISLGKLLNTIKKILDIKNISPENAKIKKNIFEEPIGSSKVILDLKTQAQKISTSEANVLITGEIGSGKKLFAHYIYNKSNRNKKNYVKVNASTILKDNIDIELFGSDNNNETFIGLLERANNSFLIFDEIAELSMQMQAKLYAALSSKTFMRVGGRNNITLNVIIIALSSIDIEKRMQQKLFREDLYYQLKSTHLHIPPLSKHPEDIPQYVNYYLDLISENKKLSYREVPIIVQNFLKNYHWRGNLSELKNFVYQLLISGTKEVTLEEVKQLLENDNSELEVINESKNTDMKDVIPFKLARNKFDKSYLLYQLKKYNYNIAKVASIIDIERTTLYRKMKTLGIEKDSQSNYS